MNTDETNNGGREPERCDGSELRSTGWLDPIVEKLKEAHKANAVGGWSRLTTPQANAMALAVIEEYDRRRREQEVLDIIDGV